MSMQQLIYVSRPADISEQVLTSILATARRYNAGADITGALIYRSDIYLQLLEGPVGPVEVLFDRICKDPRHSDVTLLVRSRVEDRLFASWTMTLDREASLLWSRRQVTEGAVLRASAREVRAVFVNLANQSAS